MTIIESKSMIDKTQQSVMVYLAFRMSRVSRRKSSMSMKCITANSMVEYLTGRKQQVGLRGIGCGCP